MKCGLVLEGGAMRGLYTAGVCDIFLEKNINVDGVIGVSAGEAFGCNYKSRQSGRAIRYNKRFCRDPRYVGLCSLILTGNLYNAKFDYEDVPFKYDLFDVKTFSENPLPFFVVCTDVLTGKPVYHKLEKGDADDLQWIRASASMPLVSKPVEIAGMKLLDGGISDSIPFEWFMSIGYKKNIVVLTRPEGYRKKESNGALIDFLLKKYPKIAEGMKKRSAKYNDSLDKLEQLERTGDVLILRPSADLHVKRVEKNPQKLQDMYDLGRSDTERRLEEIKAFLA